DDGGRASRPRARNAARLSAADERALLHDDRTTHREEGPRLPQPGPRGTRPHGRNVPHGWAGARIRRIGARRSTTPRARRRTGVITRALRTSRPTALVRVLAFAGVWRRIDLHRATSPLLRSDFA